MYLSRHSTPRGSRWAVGGEYLPARFDLGLLLEAPADEAMHLIQALTKSGNVGEDPTLAPVEPTHEVWASGVTYRRSREARMVESGEADAYERVYDAERPELFFKAPGWRVVGPGDAVRVRRDSRWNVPEPELVLVLNSRTEVVGYTAGNDVSSRDIEGENPLYLPQAKVYDGSCSLGPGIVLVGPDEMRDLPIRLRIVRGGEVVLEEQISTSQMHRQLEDLAGYLGRETSFPTGAFLMTGTGIVPEDDFTPEPGDATEISVGELVLENTVER